MIGVDLSVAAAAISSSTVTLRILASALKSDGLEI